MALIAVQQCTEAGDTDVVLTQATTSDTFAWSPSLFIYIQNDHASPTTITVTDTVGTIADPIYGDVVKGTTSVTVATTKSGMIGPFKSNAFKSSTGLLTITTSNFATGVFVAGIYF